MLKAGFDKLFQMREKASQMRPGADEGFDAHEKPFLDHLEDLRHTLMKIGATLAIATIGCFAFHTQIFELIQVPAKMPIANISEGVSLWDRLELITLSPPEFIVLMLKLSFMSGVIITFPFTLYFLFQFILPGLRQVEKRAVIPGAAVGFILFLVGVCFAFFLAAPVALKFFYVFENERISNIDPTQQALEKSIAEISLIGIEGERYAPITETEPEGDGKGEEPGDETAEPAPASSLTPEMQSEIRDMIRSSFATIEASNLALRYDDTRDKLVIVESKGGKSVYRIGEYIAFISRLVLVFGISFQLPVVVSILVKLELLTARVMRATRTYAWIIILVAAAILTPPDLMTLTLLGGPMIILYEICILIASIMERSREKKQRAEEEARKTRLEKLYSKPADELSEEEKEEIHRAEIEQYEREHAHLYDEHGHELDEHGHPVDETVARDSFHGDDSHGGDTQHDESWHGDDHYWHEDYDPDDPDHAHLHEDDPHHGEEEHKPVQDWPDRDESGDAQSGDEETDRLESDHAEPEDLTESGDAQSGDAESGDAESGDAESGDAQSQDTPPDDDHFGDDEACEPSGPIVDVNYATLEELQTLPGVGPKMAETILEYRPFGTFDELENIPGMGPEKLARMIDRLMLG